MTLSRGECPDRAEGLTGEESIAELCRRSGISPNHDDAGRERAEPIERTDAGHLRGARGAQPPRRRAVDGGACGMGEGDAEAEERPHGLGPLGRAADHPGRDTHRAARLRLLGSPEKYYRTCYRRPGASPAPCASGTSFAGRTSLSPTTGDERQARRDTAGRIALWRSRLVARSAGRAALRQVWPPHGGHGDGRSSSGRCGGTERAVSGPPGILTTHR